MVHKRLPSYIEDDNVCLDKDDYVWLVEKASKNPNVSGDTKKTLEAELEYYEGKDEW